VNWKAEISGRNKVSLHQSRAYEKKWYRVEKNLSERMRRRWWMKILSVSIRDASLRGRVLGRSLSFSENPDDRRASRG